MKFTWFNLMAWPYPPENFRETNRSVWVHIDQRPFHPAKSHEVYKTYHLYAPFLPGYGETEECGELRDMLDFMLHIADVVDLIGLKGPILVGHSMGGMIAAEMIAVAPHDISRLALIAPAGLWLDDQPTPDIFALLPYELPKYRSPDSGA